MGFEEAGCGIVDEWLIRTAMALYTEACTVARTHAGLGESFEVKVGLYQGSILSLLPFTVVMDVVSNDVRRGRLSELLYANELVFMASTMEKLVDVRMNGELAFLTKAHK